jgi:hypothetical protein
LALVGVARKGSERKRPEYSRLLLDKQVARWNGNLAQGSPITAGVYLRRLGSICARFGLIPTELIRKRSRDISNLVLDLVNDLTKEKKAGSYIHSNVEARDNSELVSARFRTCVVPGRPRRYLL